MANLRISELDFETIKTNLKTFLNDQSEFSDYDFDGSALSVLIDLLAYNTHYNAYLANMLANEMFLDSSIKRSSAVSIAKHLGYTPTSVRGSRAVLNFTVNNPTNSPATLTLNRYTPFTTTVNGTSFTFYNTEPKTISPANEQYNFNNIEIIQGSLKTFNFVSVDPGPSEKFELPDTDIDTSTLLVTVQTSATDLSTETYNLATDISNVTNASKVYFLEETPQDTYEIFFGDDIIGKKLSSKNIVQAQYLTSVGTAANSSNTTVQTFTTGSIGGSSDIDITTVTNSNAGADKETITSIKFNAPRVNAARNRAVTAEDYKSLIQANFTDAESITVYGGEDNIPPKFGKVMISLKPFEGFTISQTTKDNILNTILKNKNVLAIQPEFIDPEFFFVNIIARVKFNTSTTIKTAAAIETIVRNTISNYFSTDLQKFDKDFNRSKLSKLILESDSSIISVTFTLNIQKRFTLTLNSLNTFIEEEQIRFENKVLPGTFKSSRFFTSQNETSVLSKITDVPDTMPPDNNGTGTLSLKNALTDTTLTSNIGVINYGTGVVSISGITPTALPNNVTDFRLTIGVQDESQDINVNTNQILVQDKTTLNAAAGLDAGTTVSVTGIVE